MEHLDDDDGALDAHISDVIDTYELYGLPGELIIKTHGPAQCGNHEGGKKERCALHNPTNHHMREWPITFRTDKFGLIERLCEHDIGHPDPDSIDFFVRHSLAYLAVHGCDGCCHTPEPSDTPELDTPKEGE